MFVHTTPPPANYPPETEFVFRARTVTPSPSEHPAPVGHKEEDIMEIESEGEYVPVTLLTRKGKELAQGLGQPPPDARGTVGKTITSP